MTGAAVGPTSSQGTYTPTQDTGKQMPAAGNSYWSQGGGGGENQQ